MLDQVFSFFFLTNVSTYCCVITICLIFVFKTLCQKELEAYLFSIEKCISKFLHIVKDEFSESIPSAENEMIKKSEDFYLEMGKRRTVRFFSKDKVPLEIIQNIIETAGAAPSVDDAEPWTFVVIADKEMKSEIRRIVEEDEEINYDHRMGEKWVKDLRKLRTTWVKPYLDDVPYLIVILKQMYTIDECGRQIEHHYNELSAGIASGFLLTALHRAGLATVTSTPLNVGPSLRQLLERPDNEKVILLLAVGYPSDNCTVPDLRRKRLENIQVTFE